MCPTRPHETELKGEGRNRRKEKYCLWSFKEQGRGRERQRERLKKTTTFHQCLHVGMCVHIFTNSICMQQYSGTAVFDIDAKCHSGFIRSKNVERNKANWLNVCACNSSKQQCWKHRVNFYERVIPSGYSYVCGGFSFLTINSGLQ